MDVIAIVGQSPTVRLRPMKGLGTRRRPSGAIGAIVFRHVGAMAPASLDHWTFAASTTEASVAIHLPTDTPLGAQVWVTACWVNSRLERGPTSQPVSTRAVVPTLRLAA